MSTSARDGILLSDRNISSTSIKKADALRISLPNKKMTEGLNSKVELFFNGGSTAFAHQELQKNGCLEMVGIAQKSPVALGDRGIRLTAGVGKSGVNLFRLLYQQQ